MSKQEDLFIDSKQRNPQEVENQRSIILFQTGILRDSNFWEKRKWNELQFVFRPWWYEHQESKMDEIITPTNSNCVPKTLRAIKEGWDCLAWRKMTPNFSWEARFDMTCSHQKTVHVKDFRRGERFNNQIQKSWWKVFRSLELESFIIWNGTSQIISKKHENSVSTQEDFCIDSKQRNPEKVENQRSITLFQTGIPRDSKL